MVGDLCHSNHIKHLKKCKCFKKNCLLYVGLHSDDVSTKWKRKPILNLDERSVIFNELKVVDRVIPNAPLIITKNFIEKYNIDMVIHAHPEDQCDIYNFQYKYAIDMKKFTRFDYNKGISTTEIINRIKNY